MTGRNVPESQTAAFASDSHEIDALFENEDDWNVICVCGWESYDHLSEVDAFKAHSKHIVTEGGTHA